MIIRIRLRSSKSPTKPFQNHQVALALASLLTPVAVMALVLAIWPLAAGLKFAGAFPIDEGVFSHWQVWLVLASALQSVAVALNRFGTPIKQVHEDLQSTEHRLAGSEF